MKKIIFLDRDGTLIVDKDYLYDPSEIEFLDGTIKALNILKEKSYRFIIVTNQSGVGRGYFSINDVNICNEKIASMLLEHGIIIDAWLVCPHAPEQLCKCRKPSTGLIEQAEHLFNFEKNESFVVGDKDSDVMLGINTGMTGVLVKTGCGNQYENWADKNGYPCFDNLLAFAEYTVRSASIP